MDGTTYQVTELRKRIAYGDAAISVSVVGDDSARFVELLRALPDAGLEDDIAVFVHISVGPPLELRIDDQLINVYESVWQVEDDLLLMLNRWNLSLDRVLRVHLHAALVGHGQDGLLLAGASGAGKSTLTARLLRRGWGYHSDEAIAVAPLQPSPQLLPYRRPLTLKRGAWSLFTDLPSVPERGTAPAGRERAHVPPAELGRLSTAEAVRPRFVGFVDRSRPDSRHQTDIEPVAPARALEMLVSNTLDLGQSSMRGFRSLVQLAATVPAGIIHPSDDEDEVADAMSRVVRAEPLLVVVTEQKSRYEADQQIQAGPIRPDSIVRPRSGLVTVTFDDEDSIIYHLASGRLLRLGGPGTRLWTRLDGERSVDAVTLASMEGLGRTDHVELADAVSFLSELAAHEFLAGPVSR